VVGLSDTHGAIYNWDGIDVQQVLSYVQDHRSLAGMPNTEAVDGKELLELPCDILIPAAIEGQLTSANANRVQAKLIVEAANGPTTTEADAIFRDRGIAVIPDILANAGGVTVSYFEWVQDLQRFFWAEADVNRYLEQIMLRSFNAINARREEQRCDFRMGAYLLAVSRVAEAIQVRGIYP
jgi:glutamate dehydrogenase (NAD(P)+)